MATPSRRPVMFPDLPDWLASPWTALLPFTAGQTFRVEDFVQDNRYVIRAELQWVTLPVRVDPDDVTARYEKAAAPDRMKLSRKMHLSWARGSARRSRAWF